MAAKKAGAPKRAAKKPAPKPKPKPKPMGLMYVGPSCPHWGLVSARVYPSRYEGDKLVPIIPDQAADLVKRYPYVRNLFIHPDQIAAVSRASSRGTSPASVLGKQLAALYRKEIFR